MAQLSRPYQIALLLIAVLALAWFAVLHSHVLAGTSGGSPSASSSAGSSPKIGAAEHSESKPTPVYHGSAPGLHGLSKDIRRAHEAVGVEAHAQKLEGNAAGVQAASHARTSAASPTTTHPQASKHATNAAHPTQAAPATHASKARPSASRSRAALVAAQLRAGKVVLLLFWTPKSSDSEAVRSQVQAASRSLKGKVAADYAKAGEVGSFGTITRSISVLQTPTLLIIGRKGLATTITGFTDAFSIEQAVRETGA